MARGQKNSAKRFSFKERKSGTGKFNPDTINRFIEFKRLENRSPKTLKAYRQTLDQFALWYKDNNLTVLNEETIRVYIEYLRYQKGKWDDHPTNSSDQVGISARSTNNIIRNLRVYFNWMVKQKIISSNPANDIKFLKEPQKTFEIFTDQDVLNLLAEPNTKTYVGYRDYVMMLVLIDTGIRIGELTNLRIKDVDFKWNQITVPAEVSKNRTLRVLPISKKTSKELAKLIDYINVDDSDYLFLTQFGERFSGDTFAKMLHKYGKHAGVVDARCSPHTFRHYFAVKYLRSGGEPFSLMRILGHSDMTMTNIYVNYANREIHERHEVASPVRNLYKPDERAPKSNRGKRVVF